jgi:hypothetical protein
MSVKFLICLLSFMSALALADDEDASEQQNYDLIQEYFESALDDEDDSDTNATDNNQLDRFAQTDESEKATDATTATPSEETPADGAEKPKKKIKKKKKKKKSSTDEPSAELGEGHGSQESGKPYFANADIGLTYSSNAKTRKYSDKSLKDTETEINLDLKYLFILGKIELGPLLKYKNNATKEQLSDNLSATKVETAIGFGAAFSLNLGNIHQDKFVPYAGLSFYRLSVASTTKTDGSAESKESQTGMSSGIELGGKFFVGGHVALKPFLNFDLTFSGDDKSDESGTELVASVSGTNLALGLGMATYF